MKKKPGPKPGSGGRPRGPKKVKLSPMVLERTAQWLRAKNPDTKTIHASAAKVLDEMSS